MKQFIFILTLGLLILSCNQSDSKQKELELREREIALKEKELSLKEKDSINIKKVTIDSSKKSSNEIQNADIKIKIYFADWGGTGENGKQMKSNSREVKNYQKEKKYTFCYDSEIFDKLVLLGNSDNITLLVYKGSDVTFKKENFIIREKVVFQTSDFAFGMGEKYKIKIKKGDSVLFEGRIDSEGCL